MRSTRVFDLRTNQPSPPRDRQLGMDPSFIIYKFNLTDKIHNITVNATTCLPGTETDTYLAL